eukprot:4796589-Prymnesium_polylepis.1
MAHSRESCRARARGGEARTDLILPYVHTVADHAPARRLRLAVALIRDTGKPAGRRARRAKA